MARTADTSIATIVVAVLFKRYRWAVVGGGDFQGRCLVACGSDLPLHGMGTLMPASHSNKEHDYEQQPRGESYVQSISHQIHVYQVTRDYVNNVIA